MRILFSTWRLARFVSSLRQEVASTRRTIFSWKNIFFKNRRRTDHRTPNGSFVVYNARPDCSWISGGAEMGNGRKIVEKEMEMKI